MRIVLATHWGLVARPPEAVVVEAVPVYGRCVTVPPPAASPAPPAPASAPLAPSAAALIAVEGAARGAVVEGRVLARLSHPLTLELALPAAAPPVAHAPLK